jgi:hypothetical protein
MIKNSHILIFVAFALIIGVLFKFMTDGKDADFDHSSELVK